MSTHISIDKTDDETPAQGIIRILSLKDKQECECQLVLEHTLLVYLIINKNSTVQ